MRLLLRRLALWLVDHHVPVPLWMFRVRPDDRQRQWDRLSEDDRESVVSGPSFYDGYDWYR